MDSASTLPASRIAWEPTIEAAAALLRASELHDHADEWIEAARKRRMAGGILGALAIVLQCPAL